MSLCKVFLDTDSVGVLCFWVLSLGSNWNNVNSCPLVSCTCGLRFTAETTSNLNFQHRTSLQPPEATAVLCLFPACSWAVVSSQLTGAPASVTVLLSVFINTALLQRKLNTVHFLLEDRRRKKYLNIAYPTLAFRKKWNLAFQKTDFILWYD